MALTVTCCLVATLPILASACSDVGGTATSAPADSTAGTTAFRLAGPNGAAIVVPVRINGRGPYDLILDTGATYTCVDSSLARELALPVQPAVLGAAVGVGGAGRVEIVRIDSLRLGAALARNVPACTMDLRNLRVLAGVRGLVGLNFLRNFRLTLDFDRRILQLTSPKSRQSR